MEGTAYPPPAKRQSSLNLLRFFDRLGAEPALAFRVWKSTIVKRPCFAKQICIPQDACKQSILLL